MQRISNWGLWLGLVAGGAPLGAHAQLACTIQTQSQLLAEFSDLVPAGAITPQIMRNFVCSSVGITQTFTANINPNALQTNTLTFTNNGGDSNAEPDAMTRNSTYITGASHQNIWANRDSLGFSGPNTITNGGNFVGRAMFSVMQTPIGYGGGRPALFAAISNVVDQTGLPSSQAGLIISHEFDMEATGLDDGTPAWGRQGVVIAGRTHNYTIGLTSQFTCALCISAADAGVSYKSPILVAGPYSTAAIQLATATPIGGAPAIQFGDNQYLDFGNNYKIGEDNGPPTGNKVAMFYTGTPVFVWSSTNASVTDGTAYVTMEKTGTVAINNAGALGNFLQFLTSAAPAGALSADGSGGIALSSVGNIIIAPTGQLKIGAVVGADCGPGSPTAGFTTIKGIVTAC
jgi:hypothetical protein